MRSLLLTLGAILIAFVVMFVAVNLFAEERNLEPSATPGRMETLPLDANRLTVNTTRIGSDDPIQTAVAVAQTIYPVTEEENRPGAVVLVNRDRLAEVMVAASRVQHFPVNAPLLYVDEHVIPELTRSELLRLQPEGVPMDGNVQVYLVGTIGQEVQDEVTSLGLRSRVLTAPDPIALSEVVDNWTSTQHGDHQNVVVVANLDNLTPAIPSAFWNAHAGDSLVFVTNEGIPDATKRMLQRRANGPWLYLFGDESVISESVARALAQYGPVTRMPRSDLPGVSAFFAGFNDSGKDWSAWITEHPRDFGWGNAEAGRNAIFINVNGPGGWQNAIVATTLSHMGKHAPALAVEQQSVPDTVANYLQLLKPYPTAPQAQLLDHGWIIGGEGTISWETQVELDQMLEGHEAATAAR